MRTLINELKENVDTTISGLAKTIRNTKYMYFIILRDRSGEIQVSIDKENNKDICEKLENIIAGSFLEFDGHMVKSEYVKQGGKEFLPTGIKVLSSADASPLEENANIDTRMDYRWLDLRSDKNQLIFKIQSELMRYAREYLVETGFQEIHTPKLIGAASESGSSVFEVEYFDRKAYLAQSPQFYKQMAIASGMERVYEIAPVFRAENSNTNRHSTEYTSFDIEMAYIDSVEDVMKYEQELLKYMLTKIKENYGDTIKEVFGVEVNIPGDIPIINLDDLLTELNKRYGYQIPEHDIGDMNAETEGLAYKYAMEEYNSDFLFVTGFSKTKRPFYHMRDENGIPLGFDLIYRGIELTSGAQREHRYDELSKNAEEKGLGKDVEFYKQFFKYGCPPHGGFAFGLERLTILLLGLDHIRDGQFIFRGPSRLEP